MSFTLVIHGGAGNITPAMMSEQQEEEYNFGLKAALDSGTEVLKGGGSAVDAVVAAIMLPTNTCSIRCVMSNGWR